MLNCRASQFEKWSPQVTDGYDVTETDLREHVFQVTARCAAGYSGTLDARARFSSKPCCGLVHDAPSTASVSHAEAPQRCIDARDPQRRYGCRVEQIRSSDRKPGL